MSRRWIFRVLVAVWVARRVLEALRGLERAIWWDEVEVGDAAKINDRAAGGFYSGASARSLTQTIPLSNLCGATTLYGDPCRNRRIAGYGHCFHHLTIPEAERWFIQKMKELGREDYD